MRLPNFSTLDSLDDDEITRLAASGTFLPGCDTIIWISDTTVVKLCDDFALACAESLAIDIVHAVTLIPVPHVRRIVLWASDNGKLWIFDWNWARFYPL